MLLRASGEISGNAVDLQVVTGSENAAASGIAHADALVAFAEAVVSDDDVALATARQTVRDRLGPEELVDVAAVAANFSAWFASPMEPAFRSTAPWTCCRRTFAVRSASTASVLRPIHRSLAQPAGRSEPCCAQSRCR